MGGCRCSYRNCTSRSGVGVIHMFHYPVFDKVRCHQWLSNAHKLEFLNLTVSQLKNRVVCQHHFKDEYFMNFKKDKLTFDAVPTENGPNCDSSQFPIKGEQDFSKDFGITLDDIENEYIDKKANFSVKYGNFLTNCDFMDRMEDLQIDYKQRVDEPSNIIINDNIDRKRYLNKVPSGDLENQIVAHRIQQNNKKPSIVHIDFEKLTTHPTNANPNYTQQPDQLDVKILNDVPKEITKNNISNDRKIKIISEQKVSEPVTLIGNLEPVSPTRILPLPKKKCDTKSNIIHDNDMKNTLIEISIDNILQNDTKQNSNKNVNASSPRSSKKSEQNTTIPTSPKCKKGLVHKINMNQATLSSHKNKIPNIMSPERAAAIAQKRKFNMKLRDIIESCLDKIDDQEKINENAKYLQKLTSKESQKQEVDLICTQEVAIEPKPDGDGFKTLITIFENKMQQMENNLINRINQNSNTIMDLKNLIKPQEREKTVHIKKADNEELHKKYLFREISKYLSAEANNLIYEELFINKFVQNMPENPTVKRRKFR